MDMGLIVLGDRPKLDMKGLIFLGDPTQVSGVSIVTDDLPGSDYDG